MYISKIAQGISSSPTLAVDAKAKQMKKEGHDIIGFGAGEPDFDTAQYIKAAGIAAITDGFTKYTPVGGTLELKNAISKYLEQGTGLLYDENEIIVSNGAKHSLYNALFCLLNPGDKVIIPSPYWVSYPELVKLCGGVPVYVPTTEETGFTLKANDLEEYIDEKTKVIILNSPNNPCGSVYTRQDLEDIAKLAIKNDIFVISDEVYEKFIYDGEEHTSIVSIDEKMVERTLVVNSMSKAFAMTGWRIGFAAGPKKLISAMTNFQSHSASNPNSIAQRASLEALTNPIKDENIDAMVEEFSKRRDYMVRRINSINNLSCYKPKGSFYVMLNISKTFDKKCEDKVITDSTSFAEALLEKYKVAVVPGVAFGTDNFVRLSYAKSIRSIKKGLDRIEEFVKSLEDVEKPFKKAVI